MRSTFLFSNLHSFLFMITTYKDMMRLVAQVISLHEKLHTSMLYIKRVVYLTMKCFSLTIATGVVCLHQFYLFLVIAIARISHLCHPCCSYDDSDHCADVTANFGVISQRTPRGMQLSEFHQGLEKYRKEAMARESK